MLQSGVNHNFFTNVKYNKVSQVFGRSAQALKLPFTSVRQSQNQVIVIEPKPLSWQCSSFSAVLIIRFYHCLTK